MHEFTIALKNDVKTPLYEQLYRYITGEIHAGRLAEGEKLPSKRMLCAHLGISMSTVETAYSILAAEGYVHAVPRSGLYVSAIQQLASVAMTIQNAGIPASVTETPALFDFSTGAVDTATFPYATWAKINKETVQQNPELLQRGAHQGELPLRTVLSDFLRQYRAVACRPEQIVIGAGMEYLLDLLVKLLSRDHVYALEDPGYSAAYRVITMAGGKYAPIPLDSQGISMDALIASGANVAYVTPSHQFPMGITMPAGRRTELLKWATAAPDRYIIEDDYDSEFRYATRPIPAMQGLDESGRVIYIGTFSRSLAPSIRIAYLVLPDGLMRRYAEQFGYIQSTVSRFEQQTLSRFIECGAYVRHLRRAGNVYRARCGQLAAVLSDIHGLTLSGNQAGLHFLATHDRLSERELVDRAQMFGVRVRGLTGYAHGNAVAPSTVVLGYAGMNEKDAAASAQLLRQAWNTKGR